MKVLLKFTDHRRNHLLSNSTKPQACKLNKCKILQRQTHVHRDKVLERDNRKSVIYLGCALVNVFCCRKRKFIVRNGIKKYLQYISKFKQMQSVNRSWRWNQLTVSLHQSAVLRKYCIGTKIEDMNAWQRQEMELHCLTLELNLARCDL